jgi:predicted dehydrogenase
VKGVVWYSKGFLHNGSHFFDLVKRWLGPVRDFRIVDPGRVLPSGDSEPDVWVAFERGTLQFLAALEEHYSHYAIELIAPNGRLRYELGGRRIEWSPVEAHPTLKDHFTLSGQSVEIPSDMSRYQQHIVEELAAAIRGDRHHLCTAGEGLETQETMQQIQNAR